MIFTVKSIDKRAKFQDVADGLCVSSVGMDWHLPVSPSGVCMIRCLDTNKSMNTVS
jgi:hypothetical protein